MLARARLAPRYVIFVAAALVTLTGCQAAGGQGSDTTPEATATESTPAETASYAPGEGHPVTTDGEASQEPSATPTATPAPTAASAIEVRIGDVDYSDLEWNVSCSGLDASPTVIATAADETHTEYVVVVVGSGTDALASFSFTRTTESDSIRDRSGLTVNPGADQGNGSLYVTDTTLTSTGRGIAYDATTVQPKADTTYAVSFDCPG